MERFLRRFGSTIAVSLLTGAIGASVYMAALTGTFPPQVTSPVGSIGQELSEDVTDSTYTPSTTQEQLVISTVERVNPAVVSIVITQDVPIIEQYFEEVPGGSPFSDFFTPFEFRTPQLRQRGTEERQIGGGTGFLVSADGLIITNRHVVSQGEAEYTVFTNDGTRYEATVVARDPSNDLAVLQIEGSDFPFLTFADSDHLQVGQSVIAIGNALSEFANSVSVGIISGLSRSIIAGDGFGQAEQLDEVIQTDAAINPGNSGGPLLNLTGEVVGVNVAVAQGSENIGFALPANVVRAVVESVQETGRISRPFLGVRYVEVTPVIQERNALPVEYGVLIVRGDTTSDLAVVPGSPADRAGLAEGDIILEIDGERLDEDTSLGQVISRHAVGDEVNLLVLQDGEEQTVRVTLGEVPQTSPLP